MPAAITHYQQAHEVLKELGRKYTPKSMDAFLWGAQGPDFLYYHGLFQPWRESLRAFGSKLHHENPSKLLSVMRDFLSQNHNALIEAYVSGFLCHYSLDRTVHPLVYWEVQSLRKFYPGRSDSFLHSHVESILDVITLRAATGQLAVDFDLRKTAPKNREVQEEIALLYCYILDRLYGVRQNHSDFLQAMVTCRKTCGFLNDKCMIKKPIAQAMEKLTHKYVFSSAFRGINEPDDFDYANVLHFQWKWPEKNSVFRKDSFFDLYKKSIQESTKFIREFPTADLNQLTQGILFL